jgi:hypothetical protein
MQQFSFHFVADRWYHSHIRYMVIPDGMQHRFHCTVHGGIASIDAESICLFFAMFTDQQCAYDQYWHQIVEQFLQAAADYTTT